MAFMGNLMKKIQGMSLRWKINLSGIFTILVFTIIIYALILPYMAKVKMEEREGKLRAVVNSAVSMMDFHEKAARKQGWSPDPAMPATRQDAKREVIKNLREMRYDRSEFFFILDGDGNMVMHPTKPELEGQNMLSVQDPDGVELFREMVINAQRDGETFVRYIWQSKYSPVIFEPQMTYAQYFWPWDWVICSSLYTQDIVEAVQILQIRSALYNVIAAVAAMTILFILIHFSLSKPLKKLLSGIKEIHRGNLDYHIGVASLDEIGYQDCGSWTIPDNTTGKRRAAAWLWAQFCVSKTVDLKKFLVGGTPVRKSTVFSEYLTRNIEDYGGLIEFYRSPDVKRYTDSGRNVPHYPMMAELWWKNISKAMTGEMTPQQAMDNLAKEQDELMDALEMAAYSPVLNIEKSREEWLYGTPGDVSPKAPRPRPQPITKPYEEIIRHWKR